MYWINSNNGDYVSLDRVPQGTPQTYTLHLIDRTCDGVRLLYEKHTLNEKEFKLLKGFLPIKAKKFHNRDTTKYKTFGKGGVITDSKRTDVPNMRDIRNEILDGLLK
jgi:hypothetical protein